VNAFDVTPEQASRGRAVLDADLPMLAAHWLVEGYDSPLLRELAGLSISRLLVGGWWRRGLSVGRGEWVRRRSASRWFVRLG
jgi:hypothetical protein